MTAPQRRVLGWDVQCSPEVDSCASLKELQSAADYVETIKGYSQPNPNDDICSKVSPDEGSLCESAPDRPYEEAPAGGSPVTGEGVWCGDPKAMPDPDQDNCGSNGGGIEYIGPSAQKPSNVDCDQAPDPEIGGCGQAKAAPERDPIGPLVQ